MDGPAPRRLKIAQVVTRMDVGGVPDHVMTLARGLAPDHDVTVVCNGIDPGHAAALGAAGVGVAHIDFRRLLHPIRDVGAFLRLLNLLRTQRFDVVHTHMSKAALVGGVAGRAARAPAIVNTAHNLGFLAVPQKALRALFWVYDRLLFAATAHRIVTVSDRVREGAVKGGIAPAGKVVAIHNGVLGARFEISAPEARARRVALGVADGAPLVLAVARLVWFKGLDALVEATPALLARHPEARVVIVGGGPLREKLEAQARALGVERAVIFTGERSDVPELLAAADIFVLPSVSEGLPISILEAMTAGKPVVATSVGGIPELIVDGETGLLTPARDAGSLAEALIRLAGDPELRARMGAAGKARAQIEFSPGRMVERTAALYREILAERGA